MANTPQVHDATATPQALAARLAADAETMAALLDPEAPAFENFDGDYAAVLAELGPAIRTLGRVVEHVFEVVAEIANDADADAETEQDWDKVTEAAGEAKEAVWWHGNELAAAAEHAQNTQASVIHAVQQATAQLRAIYAEAAGRA
ncbi:hypothetical protein ACFLIM_46945 [Nonomuraea sp. M3C6]|uniref:PE family protein n=1 Tax=Nonomuraea marmarensis TaxID=3351344 RepID=A0ABW7AWH5_9ACTN